MKAKLEEIVRLAEERQQGKRNKEMYVVHEEGLLDVAALGL